MNVAVTINDTYFYPLYIMLNTLFSKHKGMEIHVFLIHSRVSKENRKRLEWLCRQKGGSFTEIYVSEQEFSHAPSFSYFTKEMYYRILAAKLLPDNLDRVLYLDPDMIVTDSLKEFYNMPLDDCFFAGIRDRLQDDAKSPYWKELGFQGKNSYINSGVLLCNLTVLRKEQNVQDVFDMLKKRGENLKFPDQDLINVLYEGKIAVADDRYNLNPNHVYWWEYLGYNFAPFLLKKPAILHFMGSDKPWRPSYHGGMYQYYWKEERKYTYKSSMDMWFRGLKIPFLMISSGFVFFQNLDRHIKAIVRK